MGSIHQPLHSAGMGRLGFDPPDDPPTVPCPECKGEAEVVKTIKRAGFWWFLAECQCGHKWEEDNY